MVYKGNMGSIFANSNKTMQCEYISAILYASLYIVKRITQKEFTLDPQLEIVSKENPGRFYTSQKETIQRNYRLRTEFSPMWKCNKKKYMADDVYYFIFYQLIIAIVWIFHNTKRHKGICHGMVLMRMRKKN